MYALRIQTGVERYFSMVMCFGNPKRLYMTVPGLSLSCLCVSRSWMSIALRGWTSLLSGSGSGATSSSGGSTGSLSNSPALSFSSQASAVRLQTRLISRVIGPRSGGDLAPERQCLAQTHSAGWISHEQKIEDNFQS